MFAAPKKYLGNIFYRTAPIPQWRALDQTLRHNHGVWRVEMKVRRGGMVEWRRRQIDCWQSVFSRNFSRDYEERLHQASRRMGRDKCATLVSPSSPLGHTTPSHLHLYTANAMVVPYPTAQKDNRGVLGESFRAEELWQIVGYSNMADYTFSGFAI